MKVPKTRAGGRMTEKGLHNWLRSQLRRISMKWPVRGDVMKENRRAYTGTDKHTKWEHFCTICNQWFKAKEIELDHITPTGSLTKWSDYGKFISILVSEKDNWQKTCTNCHRTRTNNQRSYKEIVNKSSTSEYRAYHCMLQRCYNHNHRDFRHWGGRGVTVCDEWINSFEQFYYSVGKRPSDEHSLDRINNNGNYSPSNCRWAINRTSINLPKKRF